MPNEATPLDRDLAFAVAAAREAGARVLSLRESGRWQGDMLADIGDQAADGLLQGLIRGRYPDDGILSEETVDSPERLERCRCWIVDPLDGTREFSQGRDDWAVHVALAVDGRCSLGAVALPSLGRVLWGVAEGPGRAGVDGAGAPGSSRAATSAPPHRASSSRAAIRRRGSPRSASSSAPPRRPRSAARATRRRSSSRARPTSTSTRSG